MSINFNAAGNLPHMMGMTGGNTSHGANAMHAGSVNSGATMHANAMPTHKAGNMPTNRYVLPDFEERTPYGYKRSNPYTKLFEDRIIFLGVQVDDASADDVMAQLLVLESMDPSSPITMYINSPGGSLTAMTAIYDTMQYIKPQIQTVCLGQAASAAAILLAAGTPGRRLALPNARVLIHQPAMEGMQGQATDISIVADELNRMTDWLVDTLASHTGQPRERVHQDIQRDKILTAQQAKEYGIVDQVLESRKAPVESAR